MGEKNIQYEQHGIPFKTPGGRMFYVGHSIVSHPQRAAIISNAIDNKPICKEDFGNEVLEEAERLNEALKDVVDKEKNHVWGWHIDNTITYLNLLKNGVGRLVGNPPWLVRNDTPDGTRKIAIDQMQKTENTFTPTRGYLAKGDLAAVFTARVIRLYLSDQPPNNRYGWILPGSPLISQVWGNWRIGNLLKDNYLHHALAWSLDQINPPIFDHAPNGTCVVFGEKTDYLNESRNLRIEVHTGAYETAKVVEQTTSKLTLSTPYYLTKLNRGVFYGPFCFFNVTSRKDISETDTKISTQRGSKGQWNSVPSLEAIIERDTLLSLLNSKDLKGPYSKPDCWLIAPLEDNNIMLQDQVRTKKYPKLDKFWRKCNEEYYSELRGKGGKPTLEENYGYPISLKKQLNVRDRGVVKVVYNSSGNYLRASRIDSNIIVNSKCYWLICDSEVEAQYLVGIINAPNMQAAWRNTKTSKMDFHMAPLRSVPVPRFDMGNTLHIQIAEEVDRLEKAKSNECRKLSLFVGKVLPVHVSF